MAANLYVLHLRNERDVVQARQRTREIAAQLGFENRDQIGLATAVSEMARNAFRYAHNGKVAFAFMSGALQITISDTGPGIADLETILDGRYKSETGLGIGIVGTRRLMDAFDLQTSPSGTVVNMSKRLPGAIANVSEDRLQQISARIKAHEPESPYEEIERQNQELLKTLEELRKRQEELALLNRELEDTNRGVVALYAELDDRADYLRRASEMKSAFFSNISHEFKTPLNSIIALSRMLLERIDGDLNGEQEKQVRYIADASGMLSEMVSDLLDLAKVEAGKVRVRVKAFTVDELFSTLKGMLKPLLADNRSVDLVFENEAGGVSLRTDDGKVSQILRNFISNAIKFTPQGEIRVRASIVDENVRFAVSDTGIGIAREHHETIFEEFTQIENRLQAKFRGTGLGLPLSRNLSVLLGGRVWVESEPGRGSTFYSEIPMLYRGESESPGDLQAREFNRPPVLLIDDSAEAFASIEPYFRKSEFQLIQVNSLERAERWLGSHTPAAIVASLYLQGSSIAVFIRNYKRSFKNSGAGKAPPIIGVSPYDDGAVAAMNGADVFFRKPYDPNVLLREVRRLAEKKQPKRLLLVDDNEISRYILRQILDQPWLTLAEARNGEECLQAIASEPTDAVILDLMMPGMGGMEVLERLRERDETRALPVIIYSSKTLSDQERRRLEQLRAVFLSKNEVATTLAPERVLEMLAAAGISNPENS